MFFFYQKKDVYETLMLHDYGFYKFASFKNYIDHHAEEEAESQDPDGETQFQPLFKTREQFHSYDECSQLIGSCFLFLDLRLKNKPNEAKLVSKIAMKVFTHFDCAYLKDDLMFFLDERLQMLLESQDFETNPPEQKLERTLFINRYSEDYAYLNLLDKTFFMLERGKKHAVACLACILLLSKVHLWTEKRGHWFTRLALNLKHLKMKREAYQVIELALEKQGPIAS